MNVGKTIRAAHGGYVDFALMNREAGGRDEVINEAINKLSRAACNFCDDGKERR